MSLRESLQQAFRLAFFIHGERRLAAQIATEAVARTELAATAQKKRRYYSPVGRSSPTDPAAAAPHRTKVSMDGAQLLQRLVYVVSDTYERQQETASRGELSEEDMIIRYVKHLVRLTIKRNSFYVSLGVGRLLHNYGTATAMELYSLVVGDPGRSRDDYYYRSRKRQLMKELEERFGEVLEVVRGARGERRFRTHEDDTGRDLIRKCLRVFTPWDTRCVVPAEFDPQQQELESLVFTGGDPDREHPVELRRMHALLHPRCFDILVASLGLTPPRQHLQVPCFAGATDSSGGGGRDLPRDLDRSELASLEGLLKEQAQRRRSHRAAVLSVVVDGLEKARFDPLRDPGVRLELESRDELVEVFAHPPGEEPLLLAVELLGDLEAFGRGEQRDAVTRTQGGHEVLFRLIGTDTGPWIEVGYRKVHLWSALGDWISDLTERFGPRWILPRPLGGLVMATLLLVAGVSVWNEAASDLKPDKTAISGDLVVSSAPPLLDNPTRTRGSIPVSGAREGRLGLWIASARDLEIQGVLLPLLDEIRQLEPVVLVEDPDEAALALKWLVEEPGALGLVDVEGRILWRGSWDNAASDELGSDLRRALESYLHSP